MELRLNVYTLTVVIIFFSKAIFSQNLSIGTTGSCFNPCEGDVCTYAITANCTQGSVIWYIPSGLSTIYNSDKSVTITWGKQGATLSASYYDCTIGIPNNSGTVQRTINVSPPYNFQVEASANFVKPGTTVNLTASGATSYRWTGPGITQTLSPSIQVSPNVTTTYTVTGTGCGISNSLNVTVKVSDIVPSSAHNYTMERLVLKEGVKEYPDIDLLDPDGEVQAIITYSDGLFRPIQTNVFKGSPNKRDIVVHHEYDAMGRQKKQYMHFTKQGNDAKYISNPVAELNSFYGQSERYYSEHIFEAQGVKTYGPGSDWFSNNKFSEQRSVYYISSSDPIRRWSIDTDGLPLRGNNYGNGELSKIESIDEDGKSVTTYTDYLGNTVCKKVEGLYSYYIYDDYGNLAYHIPPKLSQSYNKARVEELAYRYVYDAKNRLIEEWVPGIGVKYYVYDRWDRLVLYQKGNNRRSFNGVTKVTNISSGIARNSYQNESYKLLTGGSVTLTNGFNFVAKDHESFQVGPDVNVGSSEWFFIKYDAHDRPVIKGKRTFTGGREALQVLADSKTVKSENRGSSLQGYTNNAFPGSAEGVSSSHVLNVTYYDTYGFPGQHTFERDAVISYTEDSNNNDGVNDGHFSRVQGMVTGSRVRVMGSGIGNVFITTTTYYDDNYRPIQMITDNYLNGSLSGNTDRESIGYDFTGNVLQNKKVHKRSGNTDLTTQYRYTYDHAKRLDFSEYRINNGSWVRVYDPVYNEREEISSIRNHNSAITTNYTYNIRGWLTGIANSHFSQALQYQDASSPLYSGNIATESWTNGGGSRSFNYSYDGQNRLTEASNSNFQSTYAYDINGNINRLTRKYNNQDIDDLHYTYNEGNRLLSVRDDAQEHGLSMFDFEDQATSNNEYDFDRNGNLTRDDNKQITSVTYNDLDLPQRVRAGEVTMEFVYDAAGNKLSQSDGAKTIEYVGDVLYEDGALSLFFSEGRVLSPTGSPVYQYHVTDHLGNVRTVVQHNNTVLQRHDFYPFGMIMDESLGSDRLSLYQGKEFYDAPGWYDFHARMYDPALGRFLSVDPQNQFASPYNGMGNNPIIGVDPDGEWVHIVVGAAIGGTANLIIKAVQGDINSFWDGVAAFGIGAAAGAVGAATGGAAFVAAGGGAAGAGGFLAGAAGGAVGSAASMPIQSIGNSVYFGDPMMTPEQYGIGVLAGGLLGGMINGGISAYYGKNFITGPPKPSPTTVNIPKLDTTPPRLDNNPLRSKISSLSDQNQTYGRVLTEDIKIGGDLAGKRIGIESLKLHQGAQGKHIIGHNNYLSGKSILTADPNKLVNALNNGNFTPVGVNARGMPIVKFDQVIGNAVGRSGEVLGSTSYGVIHIGKNGIHIVPWLP